MTVHFTPLLGMNTALPKNDASAIETHDVKENKQIDAANEIGIVRLESRERAKLSEDMIQTDKHLTVSVVLPCGFEHDFFN